MRDESQIQPFPLIEQEKNLNRLKFLSQNFFKWFTGLPFEFKTKAALEHATEIFEEIAGLREQGMGIKDENINIIEKKIQKFIDDYKQEVLAKSDIGEGKPDQYNLYGNEVYYLSLDVMAALNSIVFSRQIKNKGKSNGFKKQAKKLIDFFESHVTKIEENEPMDKDIRYSQNLLKAINLILNYPEKNEIFEEETLERFDSYRSSVH